MVEEITQIIHTCDLCGKTPPNSFTMRKINYRVWCNQCYFKVIDAGVNINNIKWEK